MGIILAKKVIAQTDRKIASLAYTSLFTAIAVALVTTVWALYINSFVNNATITGLISSLLTFVAIISYFAIIPLMEKSDKTKLFTFSLLLFVIFYIILGINKSFILFIIMAILLTILATIRISSFGIIVKNKSKKEELVKNEGLIYTLLNIGWILGPLMAGYIATKFSLNTVFFFASGFALIALIIFYTRKLKDKSIKKKIDGDIIKNFIDFFKNKNRLLSYFIDGGATAWWILIYLFMPLYIIDSGLSVKWVGFFLFGIAVPLILTEYKFAKLASKYGFKKMFKFGFLITAFFTIICFFLGNIYLILISLILASFGMAILEPTTEAHFLDKLKKNEVSRFYGPFNTSRDINQFIAKMLSSLILLILPFKFLFIFFTLTQIALFFLSFKMQDFVENKEKESFPNSKIQKNKMIKFKTPKFLKNTSKEVHYGKTRT